MRKSHQQTASLPPAMPAEIAEDSNYLSSSAASFRGGQLLVFPKHKISDQPKKEEDSS